MVNCIVVNIAAKLTRFTVLLLVIDFSLTLYTLVPVSTKLLVPKSLTFPSLSLHLSHWWNRGFSMSMTVNTKDRRTKWCHLSTTAATSSPAFENISWSTQKGLSTFLGLAA